MEATYEEILDLLMRTKLEQNSTMLLNLNINTFAYSRSESKKNTHLSDSVGDTISRVLLLNTCEISPRRRRRKNISSKIHLRGRIMIMAVYGAKQGGREDRVTSVT